MTHGLVTIAVAGDGAEADSILRTLAGAGITAHLEGAEGEIGGLPHDGRAGCSSSPNSSERRRRLCSTKTRMRATISSTDPDGATPPAIFDRMAERYDELRGREDQLAEQFEFTIAEGLGAATRLLDIGCGTGSLIAAAVERLGVKAWGVDASEPMLAKARERGVRGAAFKLAQGTTCRSARAGSTPSRCAWSSTRSATAGPAHWPRRVASSRPRAASSSGRSRPSTSRAITCAPTCPTSRQSTSSASLRPRP